MANNCFAERAVERHTMFGKYTTYCMHGLIRFDQHTAENIGHYLHVLNIHFIHNKNN